MALTIGQLDEEIDRERMAQQAASQRHAYDRSTPRMSPLAYLRRGLDGGHTGGGGLSHGVPGGSHSHSSYGGSGVGVGVGVESSLLAPRYDAAVYNYHTNSPNHYNNGTYTPGGFSTSAGASPSLTPSSSFGYNHRSKGGVAHGHGLGSGPSIYAEAEAELNFLDDLCLSVENSVNSGRSSEKGRRDKGLDSKNKDKERVHFDWGSGSEGRGGSGGGSRGGVKNDVGRGVNSGHYPQPTNTPQQMQGLDSNNNNNNSPGSNPYPSKTKHGTGQHTRQGLATTGSPPRLQLQSNSRSSSPTGGTQGQGLGIGLGLGQVPLYSARRGVITKHALSRVDYKRQNRGKIIHR